MLEKETEIIKAILTPMLQEHPDIKISIHFSDHLHDDSVALCENLAFKDFLQGRSLSEIKKHDSSNGTYLLPKDMGSIQYILISTHQLADGFSYISTAVHETQHAINNTSFSKLYCDGCFEAVGDHKYGGIFQIWDEYTARKMGHRTFTGTIMPIIMQMSYSEIKQHLIEKEMPVRLTELRTLFKTAIASTENIKSIAVLLAMFSVWESDFEIDINGLPELLLAVLRGLDEYPTVSDIDFLSLKFKLDYLWDCMA